MPPVPQGLNPDMVLDYLEFVTERHAIWERRQAGLPSPWTEHPILACNKFTNVFRVLDYGSQFLLNELPADNPRDTLMRFFLYRHTGRVETWEYLQVMMGDYPTVGTLNECFANLREYRGTTTRGQEARNAAGAAKNVFQRPVFTGAYLVFPQSDVPGTDKLHSIFDLTRRLFDPNSPDDIMPDFLAAKTQAERFRCLRRNKGVADFMSMQVLTDWGYTTEFREDEFVVCGPGAVKGAAALGGRANEVHRWAVETVRALPDCPLLEGRPPSWMDIQNTLCEFSKFVRFKAGGVPYKAAHTPQAPTLPLLW